MPKHSAHPNKNEGKWMSIVHKVHANNAKRNSDKRDRGHTLKVRKRSISNKFDEWKLLTQISARQIDTNTDYFVSAMFKLAEERYKSMRTSGQLGLPPRLGPGAIPQEWKETDMTIVFLPHC